MSKSIVESAKEKFEIDRDYWSRIYECARKDLYFLSDREDAQWDSKDIKRRKKDHRPVLTIDQLGQYVNQVVNDIKKNTPSIEVVPDTDGDVEVAEIEQDLIRDILYNSDADTCFDNAASYAVKCSIGFVKIDTSYSSEKSFDQQLKIYTVPDPLTVYIDSKSTSITGSDARHGFILESVSKEDFEEYYKGKKAINFTEDSYIKGNQDDIIIAEYFRTKIKKRKIGINALTNQIEEVQEGVEYAKTREVEQKTIKRYLLSGEEVLESSEFVGEYIPIVAVFGNQQWVNGEREIYSLIRRSKDAQRMFNYWKSLETELLQKQPRATFMAAVGQVEDYPEQWENPDKTPVLPYKPTDAAGNPVPPPIRLDPPAIPVGIVQASRAAIDDIKATIGMYAASLGQESNEVSGIAIQRRNEEGDTATYHFSDNLSKSIAHVGRILANAIPKVYDTPRIVTVTTREGEVKNVGINGAIAPEQKRVYDLRQGSYKTKVVTGASYTTQRQEAASFFSNVVNKNPELMSVMGDLLFKNMDFAGAEAMAERMKKFVEPQYLDNDEEDIDPEKMQMNQVIEQGQKLINELQSQIEDLSDELRDKNRELDIKLLSERNKTQADQEKLDLEGLKLAAEREKNAQDHEIKMDELRLKELELQYKMTPQVEIQA